MRLTERKVCYPRCDNQGNLDEVEYIAIKDKKMAEEKLCQLENIEDDLGIDLITLFKALKNGAYAFENGKIYKMNIVRLDSQDKENIILFRNQTYGGHLYHFKDYGVTWALTKEELQ